MTVSQIANQVLAALLPLVIVLMGALVTAAFNLLNANVKNKQMHDTILHFVQAAAQLMPDATSGRYAYVESLVNKQFPSLSPSITKAYIESAVASLKMSVGEFTNIPNAAFIGHVDSVPVVPSAPQPADNTAPVTPLPSVEAPVSEAHIVLPPSTPHPYST
jgi:hypothetical protein